MRVGHFLTELKRRHVLRVVGAYAVAAWVAVEVFTTIQPILLDGAEWTNRLVVVLALVGFPLTFALAWIFDITPQGVRRTDALPQPEASEPLATRPRRVLTPSASGFFGLGILVALVSFAAYAGLGRAGSVAVTSIAVLPFDDMSSTQDQEYFSEGIAEELLNRLNELTDSTLRVLPRTSSFALAGQGLDTREIGRRLGVQAVLEGSVRRENDRVRVTARLIRAATGEQIWGDTFEGEATDVFGLQDAIATAIAEAVRAHLTPNAAAGERYTANELAAELYMQGMKRWHLRTDRDLRQALEYFQRAIEEDPQFALAHAALAQTYAVLPAFGDFPVDQAVTAGYAAAAVAIGLDPTLAQAYAAMGQIVQNFEWDPARAESHYKRALQHRSDPTTHQWYAETLLLLGRHTEARRHLEHVLATDASAPAAMYVDALLKTVSGQNDAALAAWRQLSAVHPEFTLGLLGAAYAGIAAGQTDVAHAALTALAQRLPARAALYSAIAQALQDRSRAAHALQLLDAAHALPASERAAWRAALGDHAGAARALMQGYEQHTDVNLPFMLRHPLLARALADTALARIFSETGIQ